MGNNLSENTDLIKASALQPWALVWIIWDHRFDHALNLFRNIHKLVDKLSIFGAFRLNIEWHRLQVFENRSRNVGDLDRIFLESLRDSFIRQLVHKAN